MTPRCLKCGYTLSGLPEQRCPECGQTFDLQDPRTFSTKPPLVRFQFWLPAASLAGVGGFLLYLLLINFFGFGWAVTLVLPFSLGAIIGFGCRVRLLNAILLSIIVGFSCLMGLFSLNILGVFCGLVMGAVVLGPLILGTLSGALLRQSLKQTRWSQRWHLPALAILLIPTVWGVVEGLLHTRYADESVSTEMTLPASAERAWNAVMFYEEVHHPLPLLMRIALPHPEYTTGSVQHVGDRKVCVYSKGRLIKQVTVHDEPSTLGFNVVEQTNIENRSVRLESGSFQFCPAPDGTRVTLTTTYEPLLGPRWVWRPFEKLGLHTLHGYVLEGMRLKATDSNVAEPAR